MPISSPHLQREWSLILNFTRWTAEQYPDHNLHILDATCLLAGQNWKTHYSKGIIGWIEVQNIPSNTSVFCFSKEIGVSL